MATIFRLGWILTSTIGRRALLLLQAITFVSGLGFALANLAADLLHAVLNARLRLH